MICIENITKNYGQQILFDGINLRINSGERVGLVGRNGHGKTTLLKIITGELEADSGIVSIPHDYRIGYLKQFMGFTQNTILEEGALGLPEDEKEQTWKVEKILTGLGFSLPEMTRSPGEFSGGFQIRLNLAKVLLTNPDLLILDEPTNYLDIPSIHWISNFLRNRQNELLLVTHDRSFMDQVVTHVAGIHRKKIRKITGITEKYYEQIAQDEAIYEKTRLNDEKKIKETELFISRFRAKARLGGLVQSRIKSLAKIEKKDQLEQIQSLEFTFRSLPHPGKHLLTAENLNFSHDQKEPLIKNLSFSINKGECICIIGKNGKGKTTLLKLLAGLLTPENGNVTLSPNLKMGIFEQTNILKLEPSMTIEEEIMKASSDLQRQQVRNICGAMMFEGDQALKKIEFLSGGEKSRVMLGKILAVPCNLLLLDEPTNHLDMDSSDALLEAINAFDGSVVMITHNEMFLHHLADKLIVFKNNQQFLFDGSYESFLEKEGWEEEKTIHSKTLKTISPKEQRKKLAQKREQLKPLQNQIKKLERAIEIHENKLNQLNDENIQAAQTQNSQKIVSLSIEIKQIQQEIETLYDELEIVTNEYEQKENELNFTP